MTKRFLLATSAFALIAPGAAMAKAPDISFFAKEKWIVERVREKTDQKPAMCAISTQLNNGYIVQLAGTENGLTNLNIDFRQPSFQKNLKYEVKYNIPGYFEGTLPTKAFKENLLVTDLRKYSDAKETIPTAGTVDIHIRDNSFRLFMTGLAAKMKDFDNCVLGKDMTVAKRAAPKSSEKAPTKPQTIEKAPEPIKAPAETAKIEAPKDVERPTAPISNDGLAPPPPIHNIQPPEPAAPPVEATADPVNLEPTAPPAASPVQPTPEKVTSAVSAPAPDKVVPQAPMPAPQAMAPQKPKETPQPKISRKSSKPYYIQTLSEKLLGSSKQEEAPREVAAVQKRSAQAYKTPEPIVNVQKHKPINVDMTSGKPELKEVEVDVVATVSVGKPLETEGLEKTIPQEPGFTQAMCEKQIAEAVSNIQPAVGQPTQSTDDFVHMRSKVTELEERVQTLLRENKLLDEELKTTLKDAAKERMAVSSDNWNLEKATMKFNEAERQVMRLGRQLQTQRAQCQNEKAQLEHMLFDPKLTEQQQLAELASLEAELDRAKTDLYRQQRQYEERIKLLEEQLKR